MVKLIDAIGLLACSWWLCCGVNSNKNNFGNLLRYPDYCGGWYHYAFIQQHFQDDVSLHQQFQPLKVWRLRNTICATVKNGMANRCFNTATIQAEMCRPALLPSPSRPQQQVTVRLCDQHGGLGWNKWYIRLSSVYGAETWLCAWSEPAYLDAANGNLVIENITYAAPEAAEVVGMVNRAKDGAIVNLLVNVETRL